MRPFARVGGEAADRVSFGWCEATPKSRKEGVFPSSGSLKSVVRT